MNENTTGTKRRLELEEQNPKDNSKKLCQEQPPDALFFNPLPLQSCGTSAHHQQREASALSFGNPDYTYSSSLPTILNSFGQDPEQQFNYYNQPCLDRIAPTSEPGTNIVDITAHLGFQPVSLPEPQLNSLEILGTCENIESDQFQFIGVNETGVPSSPYIQVTSEASSDIFSSSKYPTEDTENYQYYIPKIEIIDQLENRFQYRDKNEISRCTDTNSTNAETGYSPTTLEARPQRQFNGLQLNICFGVIVTKPIVSQGGGNFDSPVPVDLIVSGTLFKIQYEDTGKYLGILAMPPLQDLLTSYNVKIKAFISKVRSDKPVAPVKRGKSNLHESSEYSLRIVVFGSSTDITAVGRFLSTADLYLQHPMRTECELGTDYFNPHYLVRAGGEMPKIEELSLLSDGEKVKPAAILDDVAKSRILRMFDHADGIEINLDVKPSPRLRADLMKHQIKALGFMIEKESGRLENLAFPSLWFPNKVKAGLYCHMITGSARDKPDIIGGGIIADEMGLGKTLSMLALICSRLDLPQNMDEDQNPRATLIVTPKSSMSFSKHIHAGQINSLVYHGSGKHRLSFNDMDIVLTTYETLRSENVLKGPLYSQRWLRLVLDEAHHIRNRESQVFAACCRIHVQYRWCLTGTPVQNSLDDYGALLSFLGVHPFQDKKQFDYWIVRPFNKSKSNAIETLRRLVAATCLRRTKANCDLSTPLPRRYEEIEEVSLLSGDQEIYDFFKRKIQSIVIPSSQNHDVPKSKRSKQVNILSIITLLRVICDHVELLPKTAMDSWKREDTSTSDQETRLLLTSCSSEYVDDVETTGRKSPQELISEDGTSRGKFQTETDGPTNASQHRDFDGSADTHCVRSAKIDALLKKLHLQQAKSKSVVFSSWTRMLDKVEEAFLENGFNYRRIDGQSSLKSRAEAIRVFSEDSECTVMLASIGSAGEGVDFTAAQHVHILEPHWNPMAEAQAVDRVHRIGQTLPVTITRYIVPRSIETYIQWVQNDKLSLINLSLDTIADAAKIEEKRWEVSEAP
ncbi:hypothetical protein F5Y12DRAFT_788176 [Xylaria sp. FL1777]|nr:hypothetical protein F5Y12DRAFT_788176 [Xylaria sp. FL1777]